MIDKICNFGKQNHYITMTLVNLTGEYLRLFTRGLKVSFNAAMKVI